MKWEKWSGKNRADEMGENGGKKEQEASVRPTSLCMSEGLKQLDQ